MAQTRKRRSTKHRGNAAGMVESRGRTGRKPTDVEKRPKDKADERRRKLEDRRNTPPTWRGAANRAAIASLFLIPVVIFLMDAEPAAAVSAAVIAFLFYIPLSYYVDLAMYRRYQRKKAEA